MVRFLPWRLLLKSAARRYGMLDPVTLMARLRRFAQPSEIAEPIELLRAGMSFHARGLVNSKAIQHNLDWVWPYWVERQFNPSDPSFVPRAFSFSHINLTHRNWTALGTPDRAIYPLVDPRGLVTPLHDGWSLDFWILPENGPRFLPCRLDDDQVTQELILRPSLEIETRCSDKEGRTRLLLRSKVVENGDGEPELLTRVETSHEGVGWLAVAIRPYNPEGIQFVHRIRLEENGQRVRVNDEATVSFDRQAEAVKMARYDEGDVALDLTGQTSADSIDCEVGLATLAALFPLGQTNGDPLEIRVDLSKDLAECAKPESGNRPVSVQWDESLKETARLAIPDTHCQFLYDAAVRTLVTLSADDYYPGPYTYRRFWFRDACLMLHPLIAIGLDKRARRILDRFPSRQNLTGYYSSQEGEWDSNGQVLWIAGRYARLTGEELGEDLDKSLRKGMSWLKHKRLPASATGATSGLLPAGFSAEHLGPNDYYYWDDFWALGGLRAMESLWREKGETSSADEAARLARDFEQAIERSIATIPESRSKGGIPAAPGRRMDAGAIGSMVADYPLKLYPPGDFRIMRTLDHLHAHCFHRGGFFQDMIHSGINAYLTLDLAQTLLRAGDPRFADLIRATAALASPTGQWPEAIHPNTLGGCMGDGQHGWAAAEWVMMMRNSFVREEGDGLVIGSGLLPEWPSGEDPVSFGPTLTEWGKVSVRLSGDQLQLDADWRKDAPVLRIRVPGFQPLDAPADEGPHTLTPLPS